MDKTKYSEWSREEQELYAEELRTRIAELKRLENEIHKAGLRAESSLAIEDRLAGANMDRFRDHMLEIDEGLEKWIGRVAKHAYEMLDGTEQPRITSQSRVSKKGTKEKLQKIPEAVIRLQKSVSVYLPFIITENGIIWPEDASKKDSTTSKEYADRLQKMIEGMTGFDKFPWNDYVRCSVNFLYVYPNPDRDNVVSYGPEIRGRCGELLQAVTKHMPVDASDTKICTVKTTAVVDDRLKSGTYIEVVPINNKRFANGAIMDKWIAAGNGK